MDGERMGRKLDVEACGRAIAAVQDRMSDPGEPDDAVRQRIADEAGAPPRGRSRRKIAGIAALSLSTAVIAAALVVRARARETAAPSPALAFTVGDPPVRGRGKDLLSAPAAASLEVRFSEGTTVSLRPAARARILDVTASGAEILLESGRARFQVVHRPEARWQVRSGSYVIQVIGTKFETEYEPRAEELTVAVDEGAVTVAGCGLGPSRVVRAGERVKASCPPRAPDVGGPLGPEPEGSPLRGNAPTDKRGASWVGLARKGLYAEAYDRVKHDFERECQRREASELWLLGDTARLSGHGRHAQHAYQALRQRFRGTAMTADAAFALGRLAMDLDGDATAAERWFETNLGEQPNGALAPSALGRIMDLRLERGDRKGAADVAREYLRRFPAGSRAAGAKALLAAPGEAGRTGSAR
jgi:hypothetical protein